MPKHKRGGYYSFRTMNDVTNWSGVILNKEILNNLIVGDIVRVICEYPDTDTTYVEITDVLPNGYFKGKINTSYRGTYCNFCNLEGNEKNYLHSCNGKRYNGCDFHCHLKCLEKNPEIKNCDCLLKRFSLQQNEVVVFNKNKISEIPDWSNNTRKLIDIYKHNENIGYKITGWR